MALEVGASLRRSRTLQAHARRLLAPRPTGPRSVAAPVANTRKVYDSGSVDSQNGAGAGENNDGEKTASLDKLHLAIVQQKRIPHHVPTTEHNSVKDDRYAASSNLRQCLAGLLFCRRVAAAIETLRSTKVDRSVDHHDALLLALWSGMRPNVRLQAMSSSSSSIASASTASTATTETSSSSSSSPSLASVEAWGELGFQNSDDPCSDFRGGGLWALVQLASLVAPDAARNTATTTAAATPTNKHGDDDEEERAKTARACLALCENPNCYLPFAATGINFAAWIGDLCAEGRLDDVLLRAYFNHLSNSHSFDSNHNRSQSSDHAASNSRSEDGARDLNVGLDVVHAEFATLFLHQFLNEVWRSQRPPSGGLGIMGFPPLFQAFKLQSLRAKPAL